MTTRTHDANTLDFAGYYAPEKLGKSRKVTPEGFLILEGTPIARTGEQVYNAHEVNGDVSHDDPKYIAPNGGGQIIVQRLDEEVFHPDTLSSFEGKDFVINHPPEGVDVTNWKNQTVGHVQNVRRGTGIEDDLVIADIIVKDPMAIAYVNKHLPDISAGYRADYEPVEPGRAIQRNIIGNHVAGVEAGRAGARVSVRDHAPEREVITMAVKKTALRAVLDAMGIASADAAKVETALDAVNTTDASENSNEKETAKKMQEISNDMKGIKDWMKARDAKEEEEERKKKETEDARARDAEEEGKKKEKESSELAQKEAVGDTILEAEGPGHAINLGKTWTGSMTGDSAAKEPVLAAVNARAEILTPGLPKLTADAIKGNGGIVLASFMRGALTEHAKTAQGRANVQAFLVGDSIEDLKGKQLIGVFNGVSQLARMKNNQFAASMHQGRATSDGKGGAPRTIADMNAANAKFWADRAVGVK